MSGNEEEQVFERSQEQHGSPSRPQSEDEQDAILALAGLNKPENGAVTSKRSAQTGQKRPRDPEEPTATGKERLSKGETRVRPLKMFITHLVGKPRNFRLATAAAAAHAEDCYMMWCFWNEDPDKFIDIKEHLFRYSPSIYLNDTELQQALKKITTADEMEEFLKARYKTKKEERPPSKRKLNRITSNNSRNTGSQRSVPPTTTETPVSEAGPSAMEEQPAPAKEQQQQQQREQQIEPTSVPGMDDGAGPSKPVSTFEQGEGSKEPPAKDALLHAAKSNNPLAVDFLVSNKADVNAAFENGVTVLMLAAQQNDANFIKELFDAAEKYKKYVAIDAVDELKRTALMHAAIKGCHETVSALLEVGADVNMTDVNGITALMYAAIQGSVENVCGLIVGNANVNSRDNNGITALIHAVMHEQHEIVRVLCARGADVNAADTIRHWTALMHAVNKGDLQNVRILIDHNAYLDFYGLLRAVNTALEEAKKNKDAALASRLSKVSEELKGQERKSNELRAGAHAVNDNEVQDSAMLNKNLSTYTPEELEEQKTREKKDKLLRQVDRRHLEKRERKIRDYALKELGKRYLEGKNTVMEGVGSNSKKSKSGGGGSSSSKGGESIAVTVDAPIINSTPELLEIVRKATDGKLLETTEIETLLLKAAELPISTSPPSLPAASSLFVYNKSDTFNYKRDGHNFGKESHTKLFMDKKARIKVYYGTNHELPLQRRSYYLISSDLEDPSMEDIVVVHYLLPQTNASKGRSQSLGGSEDQTAAGSPEKLSFKVPVKSLSKIDEEEKDKSEKEYPNSNMTQKKHPSKPVVPSRKPIILPSSDDDNMDVKRPRPEEEDEPDDSSSDEEEDDDEKLADYRRKSRHIIDEHTISVNLRALIAIGARLQIPGLEVDVFCDAVNEVCNNPPAGCEAAKEFERMNSKTLLQATKQVMGVTFDNIDAKMKEKWEEAVAENPAAAIIKELRDVVVKHLKGTHAPDDIKDAFRKASKDDLGSMTSALGKLRKITSIPPTNLIKFIDLFRKAELSWAAIQFDQIQDAILDDDIMYAKGWIEIALQSKASDNNSA